MGAYRCASAATRHGKLSLYAGSPRMKSPSAFLVFLLSANLVCAQEPALRIVVIEGDGAINNINQKVNLDPVVEVQDENRKPVEGAAVVFFLPAQGPGGAFSNGSQAFTATTDHLGRAVARGIQFNRQTGSFTIRVTASYQGRTATGNITQTNVSGVSTSGGSRFSAKGWIILGAIAGGIAGGVILAMHHGSSSPTTSTGIVITPGTPTVGGPQ